MVNKTEFNQCVKCGCMKNIKIGNTICIRCEKELSKINTPSKPEESL